MKYIKVFRKQGHPIIELGATYRLDRNSETGNRQEWCERDVNGGREAGDCQLFLCRRKRIYHYFCYNCVSILGMCNGQEPGVVKRRWEGEREAGDCE